jgi:tetratricopeptide (TPR) repeat protein
MKDAGTLFDEALVLRDRGELLRAIELLLDAAARSEADGDKRIAAHSHLQLAHIHKRLGHLEACERHCRRATSIAPKLELASLGLFHALDALGRFEEALEEMVRFLYLRDSDLYRELMSGGFSDDGPPSQLALLRTARRLLDVRPS